MPDFTLEGRAKNIPDVQRTFLWELSVPDIGSIVNNEITEEGLVIRCRAAVLPERGVDIITSNFMGMEQVFAGKPTFPHTFTTTIEETEDQKVTKSLYAWRQKIFDVEPGTVTGGVSQVPRKRNVAGFAGYATDVYMIPYKYNGESLDRVFRFINCWPATVGEVSMGYADNAAVQYSVTFEYDYWVLEKAQ